MARPTASPIRLDLLGLPDLTRLQARTAPDRAAMTVAVAQLAVVLHAHLPYVRQPDQERALEENWLYEAIADCYLPLLEVLTAAEARHGRLRLTLSLSPTLLTMLADPGLPVRFLDYLDRRWRLCAAERQRQRDPARRALLGWYQERIRARQAQFSTQLGGDLIAAWVSLHDAGRVELLTTAATHGLAPLLRAQPGAVPAQLRVGRDAFQALTGRQPAGLWLPECGYYPGLEREIAAAGYSYSLLDSHGLEQGRPPPAWGVLAPVECGGVAFFGRDPLSAAEVWSPTTGYPGHPDYREYHADLGLEAAEADLAEFLPPGIAAGPTGLGYYRVTGGTGARALYDPERAAHQAEADARHFVRQRRALAARWASSSRSRPPLTVAAYDAELFGHWWYEGPQFLAALGRELDTCPDLEPVTLGQHLHGYGCAGTCGVAPSTWGEAGYNATWLRPETAWVYLQLRQAAEEFQELRMRYQTLPATSPAGRLLRQAARSLLLAQGSDWTFHLGRSGGGDFAQRQLQTQLARFAFLSNALQRGPILRARQEGGEGHHAQAGRQSHDHPVCLAGPERQKDRVVLASQPRQNDRGVLASQERRGKRETGWTPAVLETLAVLERLDAVFPELDLAHFA